MKQQQQNRDSTLPEDVGSDEGVQGEGNYEAARRYNEAAQQHAREADVEREARAARPTDGSEADDLLRAEAEGRAHAKEEDPLLADPQPLFRKDVDEV